MEDWRNVKLDDFNEPTEVKCYCLHFTVQEQRLRKVHGPGLAAGKGLLGFKLKSMQPQGYVGATGLSSFQGGVQASQTELGKKGQQYWLLRDLQRMKRPRGCGDLILAPSFNRGFMHALGQRWPPQLRHSGSFNVVVVRSLSCVWLFATPWTVARQASLSCTVSRSLLRLMSIELVIPS